MGSGFIKNATGGSFSRKLLVVANVILFVVFSASAWFCSSLVEGELMRDAEVRSNAFADFIAGASVGHMGTYDLIDLERYVQEAVKERTVEYVVFYDAQGKVLTRTSTAKSGSHIKELQRNVVGKNSNTLGQVKVGVNLTHVSTQMDRVNKGLAGIVLVLLVLLSGMLWWVSRSLSQRIAVALSEFSGIRNVLSGAAGSLAQNSQEVSEKVSEQAAAVAETVSAMAEMSGMISQSTEKFGEVERMTGRVDKQTEEGKTIMSAMENWVESIQEANARLQNIDSIIDEISTKARVINDIVFKTQLLSFNASIEAARAGVHGRGFAVVAEEVGNLAHTSGTAAGEIASLLETSRSQVRSILDTVSERVVEGRSVASTAIEKFNEISSEVGNISTQIRTVREANKEQDVGIRQVKEAMNRIDVATQGISELAYSSSSSSRALEDQIHMVHYYIATLNQLIQGRAGGNTLGYEYPAPAKTPEESDLLQVVASRDVGGEVSESVTADFDQWMRKTGS